MLVKVFARKCLTGVTTKCEEMRSYPGSRGAADWVSVGRPHSQSSRWGDVLGSISGPCLFGSSIYPLYCPLGPTVITPASTTASARSKPVGMGECRLSSSRPRPPATPPGLLCRGLDPPGRPAPPDTVLLVCNFIWMHTRLYPGCPAELSSRDCGIEGTRAKDNCTP
jgi:hypothetical protein